MLLTISACMTLDTSKQAWPKDVPARSIFVKAYKKQFAAGTVTTDLQSHLNWILKFYKGSVLYPTGWNDMIELVINSIDGKRDKRVAEKRLIKLGREISIEWAQINSVRKIDSSNIATWGSALRTSVEREEQFKFLSQVEADVDALLAGELKSSQIEHDRYYPLEEFDDF